MARSKAQDTGDAGEDIFKKLGREAGFSVEKHEPDRLGLDFFVEVPTAGDARPRDQQRATHALIQVKTTRSKRSQPRISVENLKRLVDSDLPCFVFIIVLAASSEDVTAAFLVEVDERLTEQVLKRVVECEAKGRSLHKEEIAVRPNVGCRLAVPLAKSFAEKVRGRAGPDGYAERKSKWRKAVGYVSPCASVHVQFKWEDGAQHLLGRAPRMAINVLESSETRFGFTRTGPIPSGPAFLSFDNSNEATLVASGADARAEVRGRLFSVLPFVKDPPAGTSLWRFVGPGIEVERKAQSLSFGGGPFTAQRASLVDWGRTGKFLDVLSRGPFDVELSVGEKRLAVGTSQLTPDDEMRKHANLLMSAARFADSSGMSDASLFEWELWAQADAVRLLGGQSLAVVASIDPTEKIGTGERMFAVCVHAGIWVGERLLGRCWLLTGLASVEAERPFEVRLSQWRGGPWLVDTPEKYVARLTTSLEEFERQVSENGWTLLSLELGSKLPRKPQPPDDVRDGNFVE